MPLYDQGLTNYNVAVAASQLDQALATLNTTRLTVESDVRSALATLISARASLVQASSELTSAQVSLDATQAQYRVGASTILNVVTAEANLTTAQSSYIRRSTACTLPSKTTCTPRVLATFSSKLMSRQRRKRRRRYRTRSTLRSWRSPKIAWRAFKPILSARSPTRSGIGVETVIERIVAMLQAGTIRRVRQTLLSTSLARGALCAWEVPAEKLDAAFDFMFRRRSVLRPRRYPIHRLGFRREQLPALDDAQSPAGLLAAQTRAMAEPPSRGATVCDYAGQDALRAGSWPRSPAGARTGCARR